MRVSCSTFSGGRALEALILVGFVAIGSDIAARAQTPPAKPAAPSPLDIASDATVETLFKDFLHYARLGQFVMADSQAKALLVHPELKAVTVMELAHKDPEAIATLQLLIMKSTIPESARRVMELIEQGEFERRQEPQRIAANITLLGGDPQQEATATKHLIESGEYAVPQLVRTLIQQNKSPLRTRIVSALPKLGKAAVNPLVIALAAESNDVRQDLIYALGEIGYPQAIPYLRKAQADAKAFPETKKAVDTAVSRIETLTGRAFPGSTQEMFQDLAERYYREDETLRADPRLETANVWYWDASEQELKAVVVPQKIFGPVMAMRCSEEAVLIQNDYADATGMWLASNIRRESRLGLNVEIGEVEEAGEVDATRPAVFPRALYFTQAAGPLYAHRVLQRAVEDRDSAVALGAIAALRETAGASSLVGPEDFKQALSQCLRFPDSMVRIKAALTLGSALPRETFADAQFVVPVLAEALTQSGKQQVLVVDADQGNANRVMAVLRAGGRDVIAETGFDRAMQKARSEFQAVSAVYLSTDLREPDVTSALGQLRAEFAFQKTPVVILTKQGQSVLADQLSARDTIVETVDAAAEDAAIEAALERVRGRSGQMPLDADTAKNLALQAAETLRLIATDGRTVLDASAATPALIAALSSADERLQTTAASVLALSPSPAAQRAIAHVALDEKAAKSLRRDAFASLANSAKTHGNLLEMQQITRLVAIAKSDPDLAIRTSATKALGAANLKDFNASEILRSFYGG